MRLSRSGQLTGLTRRKRIVSMVRASHPEPVAVVTLCAGLLALAGGRGWGTLWVLAAIGSGQLAVGWGNDYLDRDSDRASGRVDKPVAAGQVGAGTVRLAAIASLASCVPFSLASGVTSAVVHFGALTAAFAYNVALKTRPASALAYAVAFGLLPAVVSLGLTPSRWPPFWVLAAAALIGVAGHFTQVLPDIQEDRRLGSRGLPQLLGERPSAILAAMLLLAATALITFGPGRPTTVPIAAIALVLALAAAIVVTTITDRMKLAFKLTLATAAVAVLGFLASGRSL